MTTKEKIKKFESEIVSDIGILVELEKTAIDERRKKNLNERRYSLCVTLKKFRETFREELK